MASDNRHLLMLALMSLPIAAIAMTPLDDSGLADIRGQDGLTVNLESTDALQAQQLNWITDSGNAPAGACSGGVTDQHACTQLNGLTLQGDGNPLRAQLQLDVGSDGTVPLLALQYDWQPSLFTLDGMTLQTGTNPAYAGHSLGQVALYSQGNLALVNQGIFSRNGQHANLDFSMTGDWIYRQGGAGSAEMSIGNLMIQNRFSNGPAGGHAPATGIIGIDSNGLLLEADHTYTALEFDLMYKAAPTNFDRTGRQPLIYGAWIGGLKDASVRVSAGGIGYGYDGTVPSGNWDYAGINTPRSEGLNIQAQWDFDTDFQLRLGHADGDRTRIEMGNWRRLGNGAGPMFAMDAIVDVLQNNTGPAGLCFGGGFTSGQPDSGLCSSAGGVFHPTRVGLGDSAFAVLLRNGHLHAYSEQLTVTNPTSGWSDNYDWGLVLTLGKLDADFLVYPQGPSSNLGLRADATLMVQSPGFWEAANSSDPLVRATASANWQNNSHFLFADTTSQVAVGLLNNDLLWEARDLYLTLGETDPAFPALSSGIMLQTDALSRYQVRGLLGAGSLNDLSGSTVNVALWDLNLSADQFRFVLYPANADGLAVLGFDGYMNLDGNAYLSLAEVSSPSSAFRLSDVSGSIGWRNGKVLLKSGDQNSDGLASLTIANELLLGQSADFGQSGGGTPLVGQVSFGDQQYGRIAMPGGTWHSEIIAKVPPP